MDAIDDERYLAILRGMQRQMEQGVIDGIRCIRPELLLRSRSERIEELEDSDRAALGPVQ